jgi:hypothetical protein
VAPGKGIWTDIYTSAVVSAAHESDLPVLASTARPLEGSGAGELSADRRAAVPGMLPAVQAAAVAAGGFVAGAALVGLAHRRRERALSRARKGRRRRVLRGGRARQDGARSASVLEIVGSRSLLVDVHLLGARE